MTNLTTLLDAISDLEHALVDAKGARRVRLERRLRKADRLLSSVWHQGAAA